jgi:hypothetical protein
MLALACVNASVPYPYAYTYADPWAQTAAVDVHHDGHWAGPAAIDVSHSGHWAAPAVHWAAPVATSYANQWSAPAHSHVHTYAHAHSHDVVPDHGATYTAKTLGAIHTAPLPGHVLSQTSLNLAAPAGTW